MDFGEAISAVKAGMRACRKGWNGKNQYIQLATGISYKTVGGEIVNCDHKAMFSLCGAVKRYRTINALQPRLCPVMESMQSIHIMEISRNCMRTFTRNLRIHIT